MVICVLFAVILSAAFCFIARRHKKAQYGGFLLTFAATVFWALEAGAFHVDVLSASVLAECMFVWSILTAASILMGVILLLIGNGFRILKIYKHGHGCKNL